MCGKLLRPNKNVMDQIKETFEALKHLIIVLHPLLRGEVNAVQTLGNNFITRPETHEEVLRKVKVSILRYGTGGRMMKFYRTSQLAHNWTDAWVRSSAFIVHFDISHNAPSSQSERQANLIHLRSLDSNKQAGPLWERSGSQEAKRVLPSLQTAERQGVHHIPVDIRTRQNNTLDPAVQEYLDWLSFHWAEHFAEPQNSERQQPSSSSSWSPSPTRWSSSSWDQRWQKWHSCGWQDEKWSDRRSGRQSWIHAPRRPLETVGVSEKFNVVQVNL